MRPNRRATASATCSPTCVEPVKEISGRRRSASMRSPTLRPGPIDEGEHARRARGRPSPGWRCAARRRRRAGSGRPASTPPGRRTPPRCAVFQDQTATGKLNAVMTPTTPSGCHCSIMRCAGPLGGHRQAVELARQADREVADVDHLLHLAAAFGADLAHLEAHQVAERLLAARGARCRGRAPPRRASAPAPCASVVNASTAAATTCSYDSGVACTIFAMGSPVVGLYETTCVPFESGSTGSGRNRRRHSRPANWSFSSRADVAGQHG